MQDQAQVVIIGAGIVGCSTAYYLTQLGWHDVVVLEQGPLYKVYGSTSHAPGLMFQHNHAKSFCQLAMWSVETYSRVQAAKVMDERCFWQTGSFEIAHTPERWQELKRKLGTAKSWGLEAFLVTPAEIKARVPQMCTDDLFGAFYVPSDADIKGVALLEGLTKLAEVGGAKFYPFTRVTAIDVKNGVVQGVTTTEGKVRAENVICAAGLWGPLVGKMAGVGIPQTPCEHLYVKTEPLPELAGAREELEQPFVRYQDRDMYFRQHREAYGFGSYRHAPLIVFADELQENDHPAIAPFKAEHFEESMRDAVERYPCLSNAGIADAFNGMFSFTPDGCMNLGQASAVRGFWSAEAVWVTHGGGVGKAIAEWMVSGTPPLDLREHDINRWHSFQLNRDYVRARAEYQYIAVYDIIHPLEQSSAARGIRVSPFYVRQKELGGEFFESAGWERPQWYTSNEELEYEGRRWSRKGWAARQWSPIIAAEHWATRNRVGLFDLTAFTKLQVHGPGALAFLQSITANEMDQPVGRTTYTAMLNERGGIEADLTVTRLSVELFWVITGGSAGMHDIAWMRRHMPNDGSVEISDITSKYATLGLWGPRARDLMRRISSSRTINDEWSNNAFPYMTSREATIGLVPVRAIRISYAGELGWELYTHSEFGLKLWDTLWEEGQEFGITAVGSGAFDSLRLEKGYRLWGADIHSEYDPFSAGLGFAVKLTKGDFIGRESLVVLKEKGITRKLCCLKFDDADVAVLGKEPILRSDSNQFESTGRVLGYVTSANQGYTVGQSIAYGYLPVECAKVGTRVNVYFLGDEYSATVTQEPLFDPKMIRVKS